MTGSGFLGPLPFLLFGGGRRAQMRRRLGGHHVGGPTQVGLLCGARRAQAAAELALRAQTVLAVPSGCAQGATWAPLCSSTPPRRPPSRRLILFRPAWGVRRVRWGKGEVFWGVGRVRGSARGAFCSTDGAFCSARGAICSAGAPGMGVREWKSSGLV